MKCSVLLLITFASVGYAGLIATDISDPPPGPLEFMSTSIWAAHPFSSNFLLDDYSVGNSPGAWKVVLTSESIGALTRWTGELTFSDLVQPELADWRPLVDSPSFHLMSGLAFMIADPEPAPEI